MKKTFQFLILFLSFTILISCGRQREPLEKLVANFAGAPEYSIILQDMKEEGGFSSSYYHKYKVIQGEKSFLTEWLRVSRGNYQNNQNFLGMTLVSKTKDGVSNTPHPPGYQYMGNSQYGEWRKDSGGNSFWAFYGQYAFFTHMFGWGNRTFYRTDYDAYRTSQASRRPFFGRNKEYGTGGKFTKRTNPNFFDRKMSKQRMAKSRFSDRVGRRFGGSRSSFGGGRGFGSFGK
ncbi:MAG: hypothetical protein QF907_00850 [Nitrospinota bacterium]|jgi:hypothetical protein|nr:hypothetical protein [Nitrospinota bacterium]